MVQFELARKSNTKDVSPIALYNPYHRLTWSAGFRVFPASFLPYNASSGQLVLEYSPSSLEAEEPAHVGVGALQTKPCFRFDFISFRAGCAARRGNCDFNITGFIWDSEKHREVPVASQTFSIRSCPAQHNCALKSIAADDVAGLTNLTSVIIGVTSGGQPQRWWADDLVFNWTDGSCESAICRSHVHDSGPNRGRRQNSPPMFGVQH